MRSGRDGAYKGDGQDGTSNASVTLLQNENTNPRHEACSALRPKENPRCTRDV